jgi:hypothetical protein
MGGQNPTSPLATSFPDTCAYHIANTFLAYEGFIIVSELISETVNSTNLENDKVVGVRKGI